MARRYRKNGAGLMLGLLAGAGIAAYFLLKKKDESGSSPGGSSGIPLEKAADLLAEAMTVRAQQSGARGTVQISAVDHGDVTGTWSASLLTYVDEDAFATRRAWETVRDLAQVDVRSKYRTISDPVKEVAPDGRARVATRNVTAGAIRKA